MRAMVEVELLTVNQLFQQLDGDLRVFLEGEDPESPVLKLVSGVVDRLDESGLFERDRVNEFQEGYWRELEGGDPRKKDLVIWSRVKFTTVFWAGMREIDHRNIDFQLGIDQRLIRNTIVALDYLLGKPVDRRGNFDLDYVGEKSPFRIFCLTMGAARGSLGFVRCGKTYIPTTDPAIKELNQLSEDKRRVVKEPRWTWFVINHAVQTLSQLLNPISAC